MYSNIFNLDIDERLSAWAQFRAHLETAESPFQDVWDFWKSAPFIPYNNKIDPFYQLSWPSPWQVIVDNKYDDFTKALMVSLTLKLTKRFKNSEILLKTLIDQERKRQYNIVYVDGQWAINFDDGGPVLSDKIPESFVLENLIDVKISR